MMKSYIVRIYKTEAGNPDSAVGIVEDPMTENNEKFQTFEEMKERLKSMVRGKKRNKRVNKNR